MLIIEETETFFCGAGKFIIPTQSDILISRLRNNVSSLFKFNTYYTFKYEIYNNENINSNFLRIYSKYKKCDILNLKVAERKWYIQHMIRENFDYCNGVLIVCLIWNGKMQNVWNYQNCKQFCRKPQGYLEKRPCSIYGVDATILLYLQQRGFHFMKWIL